MNRVEKYIELLATTEKHSQNTDLAVYNISCMLKNILTISKQMNYTNEVATVNSIIEKYGRLEVGTVEENKHIKYLVVNAPIAVREKIQNLLYHVKNKQECDISEKIVILK